MPSDDFTVDALESLGSRARTAIGWKFLSQGMTYGVQIVTGIVLARLLMPKDFGVLGMATMVTGLVQIFQDLGMGQALVQRREVEQRHVAAAFWGTLVMGLLLCGLAALIAPYVGLFFKEPRMVPVLRMVALTFVISPFGTIPYAMLQRKMDFRTPFYSGIAGALAYAAVGVTMALQGYGYWSLVGGLLASTFASVVALCLITRHLPPLVPSFSGMSDLLSFGVGATGVGIFSYIAQQADYFVVGRRLDSAALGLYTRAFTLVHQPLGMVGNVLSPVLFPMFARLRDDHPRARAVLSETLNAVSLLFFPALGLCAVSAPELVPVVLGKQWLGAVAPIQVLAISGMLRVLINPSAMLAKGFGAVYSQVWRNAVYAGVLATAAYVGTFWGIVGVAWGVLFSTVVVWALNVHLLYRCSGYTLRSYVASMRGGTLCALAGAAAAAAVRNLAVGRGLPMGATLAVTLVGGLVAALLLGFLSPFPEVRRTIGHLRRFAVRHRQDNLS